MKLKKLPTQHSVVEGERTRTTDGGWMLVSSNKKTGVRRIQWTEGGKAMIVREMWKHDSVKGEFDSYDALRSAYDEQH